jgi:hypothetical protein
MAPCAAARGLRICALSLLGEACAERHPERTTATGDSQPMSRGRLASAPGSRDAEGAEGEEDGRSVEAEAEGAS